jgi:hypothetical protein
VASRADALPGANPEASPGPSLGGAARAALSDLYYHSWRLVPANVVWSVIAIGVLIAIIVTPVGLVTLPALAIPTAGLFRMAGRIARGEAVSFWDAIAAWRTDLRGTLALGVGLSLVAIVLGFNVATGLMTATLLGWSFATLAFWGLIAAWVYAWTAWPILCDPARSAWPVRERLRLAALLALAHPARLGAMGIVLLVFLAASAVAIVALATASVAIAAVITTRFVLPAADRFDMRVAFASQRGLPEATAPGD